MEGAAAEARARGYATTVLDDAIVGEARLAGPRFASEAFSLASGLTRPACVIASGETTVRVLGNGRGGRNQELVLSAFDSLQASKSACVLASVGTDGIDGPTDAAGAVADSQSAARAASISPGWDVSALANNDAYPLLDRLGDLIRTGPTGTNVGDLQVFLLA
ncbi:MAG: MOFRL family protein [Vicinamibacterales bacterium]